MIVEADFSQLEWRVCAQLSQDPIMIREILDGVDIHEVVRSDPTLFNGKVERVWAKVFNFRAIYMDERYGAYAFFMDHNMPRLPKRDWDRIVAGFYAKYKTFSQWHISLFQEVTKNRGKLVSPSGREFWFTQRTTRQGLEYNRAEIYNYPVQGTAGGEILPLALVQIRRALLGTPIKITNTVHDSIIFDTPKKYLDLLAETWYNTLKALPSSYTKLFGVKWVVPLTGELKGGPSWGELEKI